MKMKRTPYLMKENAENMITILDAKLMAKNEKL